MDACGGGPWDDEKPPVTQSDLESWGREILAKTDTKLGVVFQQLACHSEQHTIALMAEQRYTQGMAVTMDDAVASAKKLYRKTQASLEKDHTIIGRIKEKTCKT